MPLCVPVMDPVTVSVAVIDWVPGRLERGREGVDAGVAGGEGVVGRQDRLGVAAGEVDRAGVAGGDVAVSVKGRDRDVVAAPAVVGLGKPVTVSVRGRGG